MGREWIMVLDGEPQKIMKFWSQLEANDWREVTYGEVQVNNGLIWNDPDRAAFLHVLRREDYPKIYAERNLDGLPDIVIIWSACIHSCWFDGESWKKLIEHVRRESEETGTPIEWFAVKS